MEPLYEGYDDYHNDGGVPYETDGPADDGMVFNDEDGVGYEDDDDDFADLDDIDGYFEGDSDDDALSDGSVCEYVPAAAATNFVDDLDGPRPVTEAEIFDDLAARFIANLPDEDLCSLVRVGFHIQQAYWFYIDYYRGDLYPHLEQVSETQLARELLTRVFGGATAEMVNACKKWKNYSKSINTYGIICLNKQLNHCIMVQTGTIDIWNFPKGKINAGETKMQCATRETYEEIGVDLAGLLNEQDYIEVQHGQKKLGMFVYAGVPMDLPLQPVQQNETMQIRWFPIFGQHGISTMLKVSAERKAAKAAAAAEAKKAAAAAAAAAAAKKKGGKGTGSKGKAAEQQRKKNPQPKAQHRPPKFKFAQTAKAIVPKLRLWIFSKQKAAKEARAAAGGGGGGGGGGGKQKKKKKTGAPNKTPRTSKKASRNSTGSTSGKKPVASATKKKQRSSNASTGSAGRKASSAKSSGSK